MDSLRSWNVWVLAWVLLVACSQNGAVAFEEGDASVDASTSGEGSTLGSSKEARAVVARLDARLDAMVKAPHPTAPGEPALLEEPPPSASVRLSRAGDFLHVLAEASPRAHHAELRLPMDARAAFRIADKQSGLEAAVALRGASEAEAEIVEGQVVYRKAAAFGTADLVHRPSAEATEDFILFDENPEEEVLAYELSLGANVAGLRLVENTLELIDEGGAPRLRVAPPYVIGADGQRHDATLSVEGCAFDTNPAAPWGREPIAPGASECTVRVAWGDRGVSYPAVVDPTWTTTGAMRSSRYYHTATLLDTGKVLVAGGYNGSSFLGSAELYDPDTGSWASTGSMTAIRQQHTATKLDDGRVLVTGGYYYTYDSYYGYSYYYLTSANLYDAAAGTWSSTGSLKGGRYRHVATRLADGSVLVAGGLNGSTALSTAERYVSGVFESVGNLVTSRYETQAVTLLNGKALIVGGYGGSPAAYLASAELYEPSSKTFAQASPISGARYAQGMTLLADGRVLMAGGYNGSTYLASGAIYNPATNVWSAIPDTAAARAWGTMTLLADGNVLFAGGYNGSSYLTSPRLFDPIANRWLNTSSQNTGRRYHTATRLPSGNVLLAGGYNPNALASSEIFALAKTCTKAADCANGFCVDGYCCDSACTGVCNQCDQAGFEGNCRVKTSGSPGRYSCAPYMCDGTSADCPSSCTSDAQCVSGTFCESGACVATLGQGSTCARARQCTSGNCSDGFCCDQGCGGACDVCARSLGATADGTCTNLPPTTACGHYLCTGVGGACPNACSSDAACVDTAYCNSNGHCTPKLANGSECTAGNQCTSDLCVDGYCCNDSCSGGCERCDIYGALGNCVTASVGNPGSPSCSPYLCNGTSASCPSSCTSDAQCASDAYCENGSCIARRAAGGTCTLGKHCQSGVCTDGVCCDKACSGACETCLASQGAEANGKCTPLPAGTINCENGLVCTGSTGTCPTSCALDTSCAPGLHCNASKQCVPKLPQGSGCTADNQCTFGNCVDGYCCTGPCAGGCDRCNLPGFLGTCKVLDAGSSGANPSCGAFLCNGMSASCPTTCTADAQCAPNAACVSGTCEPKRALGASCTVDKQCTSGSCSDGVCCDTPCNGGGCHRCDLPTSIGVCKIAPAGSEGSAPICKPYLCDGTSAACPSSCTNDASCAAGFICVAGTCQAKKANGASCAAEKECESGICADGICCDAACTGACERCDIAGSKGTCKPVPAKMPGEGCGMYLCDGKSSKCPSGCTSHEGCDDGYCYAGQCYAKRDVGESCSAAAECQSGFCTDGTCCESACDGQCARCDNPGALGTCQAVTGNPVGARPPCGSASSTCAGSCDGVEMDACTYPKGTLCASKSCVDGVMSHGGKCNDEGACVIESEPCAPYACGDASCLSSCADDDDCIAPAECVEGACKAISEEGAGEERWEGGADEGGCGCRVAGERRDPNGLFVLGGFVVALSRRRRTRRVEAT